MSGSHSAVTRSQKRFKYKKIPKNRSFLSHFIFGAGSIMEIFPSRRTEPPRRFKRYSTDYYSHLNKDLNKLGGDFRNAMGMTDHE